jgi:hypothetical protein
MSTNSRDIYNKTLKTQHFIFLNCFDILCNNGAPVAQSVEQLTTGWTVRGSTPGGGTRFSALIQTGPGTHPAYHEIGTGSFPGEKRSGHGVDHPPHLAPRLKKE